MHTNVTWTFSQVEMGSFPSAQAQSPSFVSGLRTLWLLTCGTSTGGTSTITSSVWWLVLYYYQWLQKCTVSVARPIFVQKLLSLGPSTPFLLSQPFPRKHTTSRKEVTQTALCMCAASHLFHFVPEVFLFYFFFIFYCCLGFVCLIVCCI